jgi:hypothetical protein
VARALGSLPRLKEALARGELSYSKVRALTRVATPETEERLLAVGRAGTAEHVELIVRGWRRMDRKAEAEETTRRHRHRALHVYPDGDGVVVIRGQALAAAREALYRKGSDVPAGTSVVDGSPEAPTMEQQQADALALVAELHEEGYQVERQTDDQLCFRRPDGRALPDVPAAPALPATPCETLRARQDGLQINAKTSMPGWQGERLDVGYAISVLHPRAGH